MQVLHSLTAIRCIFSAEREVLPWRLRPVAMLEHKRTSLDTRISNTVSHNPAPAVGQNAYHDAAYVVVRVAQQIVLQSNKPDYALITTKSFSLVAIEPRATLKNCNCTLVAVEIIGI